VTVRQIDEARKRKHAGGRPARRRNATEADLAKFRALLAKGFSPGKAGQECGFSYSWGVNKGRELTTGTKRGAHTNSMETLDLPPVPYEELDEQARRGVDDFLFFRWHFLGRRSKQPWSDEAGVDLTAAEEAVQQAVEPDPTYLIVNVYPGAGKSTFIHDWVVWLIVRYRALGRERRVQLGADAQVQSRSYSERIRQTLENNRKLISAYGRFRPLNPVFWSSTAFRVETLPGVWFDEKEPTVFAVSRESSFLGFRGHVVVWDDLITKKNQRTPEGREQLASWWHAEAESRVEPRGFVVLVGTRAGPDDLFRRLLDMKVQHSDDENDQRPIYRHIVYPIHDKSRCADPSSREPGAHAGGCLADPGRFSWSRVLTLQVQLGPDFELTYQQHDAARGLTLVQREWVEGGADEAGNSFVGCWDYTRGMWEPLPEAALGRYACAITVDPSPTRWWAIEAWLWDKANNLDYLIGMHHRRMLASDLLDLEPGSVVYTGVLEETVVKVRELGVKIRYLVLEDNSAQRFMSQYAFFKHWLRSRGMILRSHTTGINKADPERGIETVGARWMYGQVRLPGKTTTSKARCEPLVREALTYPEGATDDCLMAEWFFHFNRDRLTFADDGPTHYGNPRDLAPIHARQQKGELPWAAGFQNTAYATSPLAAGWRRT
jgi:hypothetical protein